MSEVRGIIRRIQKHQEMAKFDVAGTIFVKPGVRSVTCEIEITNGFDDIDALMDGEIVLQEYRPAGTHKCPTCGAAIPQKVVSP